MKSVITTNNAPKAVGPYSQAIVTESLVFLSGQIPLNPKTGVIESDDIKLQTKQVLDNIAAVLRAASLSFEDIVKTTVYLTDIADFSAVNEVYEKYFGIKPPARSAVAVAALPKGAKVEIEVIASR